jgi:hypothetical protein
MARGGGTTREERVHPAFRPVPRGTAGWGRSGCRSARSPVCLPGARGQGPIRQPGGTRPEAVGGYSDRGSYSAARKFGYILARAASFARKALALAQGAPQGLSPPRGPFREGRAAAPPRTLPRTVRSRVDCRLSSAPHSMRRPHPLSSSGPLHSPIPEGRAGRTAAASGPGFWQIGRRARG